MRFPDLATVTVYPQINSGKNKDSSICCFVSLELTFGLVKGSQTSAPFCSTTAEEVPSVSTKAAL